MDSVLSLPENLYRWIGYAGMQISILQHTDYVLPAFDVIAAGVGVPILAMAFYLLHRRGMTRLRRKIDATEMSLKSATDEVERERIWRRASGHTNLSLSPEDLKDMMRSRGCCGAFAALDDSPAYPQQGITPLQ